MSEKNVDGIWKGAYAHGVEIFVIYRGGSYTQVFYRDKELVYRNAGTWKIDRDGHQIYFEGFRIPVEFEKDLFREEEPGTKHFCAGAWSDFPLMIIFFDDLGYWVYKQKRGADSPIPKEEKIHVPDGWSPESVWGS